MFRLVKVFVLTLLMLGIVAPSTVLGTYSIGDTVEDFTLPDLEGNPVSLYDFEGDVILLNFFATWCPPCNIESPILEEFFWQEYRDYGFTVLAVDLLESPCVVADWVEELGLTYPTVISPDWSIFIQFPGAGGIPYNAVIDQNMVLQLSHYSFDEDEAREMVEDLLEFNPVDTTQKTFSDIKALYR